MKKQQFAYLAIVLISIQQLGAPPKSFDFEFQEMDTGDKIMEEVERRFAANSEIELIKMVIKDGNGNEIGETKRFLSIIARDPAGNYSYLIRFLEPESIRGVTLVTREQGAGEAEQFLYMPGLGQVRHIKGSGKSGSFMGTDFSYEDLRKENSTEYTFTRQFDDTHNGKSSGKECYVILSAPADLQKVATKGYSSRMIYVEKVTYRILKIEYYNEQQDLMKTFEAKDYGSKKVNGSSERPHEAIMTNYETGGKSILTLEKSRLNFDVDPSIFTIQAIEAWTPEYTKAYMDIFNTPEPK